MATVVRLGPVPLLQRRSRRLVELERLFGTPVELIEVSTLGELARALTTGRIAAVVIDAPPPGELAAAVAAAGTLPVLRPLWRRQRNARGEIDEVFDGYGLLTPGGVVRLGDRELSTD